MQISTNSNQYLYSKMIAQMGARTPSAGQNMPNQAANPSALSLSLSSSSSSSSITAPAAGSMPSSQFSSAMLAQLIQMQGGSSSQSSSASTSSVLSSIEQKPAARAGDAAGADASLASAILS